MTNNSLPPPQGPPPGDSTAQFDKGIEEVRATAKWMIGAFGAIATALLAGISLSDLGKVHGTGYVIAAFISVGVALLSATVAIFSTARVLVPEVILLDEIEPLVAPLVDHDVTLLRGQGTDLHQLLTDYKEAYAEYAGGARSAEDGERAGRPADGDDAESARDPPAGGIAAEPAEPDDDGVEDEMLSLDSVIQYLRGLALAVKIRNAFRRSLFVVMLAAVVAGLSVATFAWAANHTPTQKPLPAESEVDHQVVVIKDQDTSHAACVAPRNDRDSCYEDSAQRHDAETSP